MRIKKWIAGMLVAALLAGPGEMTCYAAGSGEAENDFVNAVPAEETAAEAETKAGSETAPGAADGAGTETKSDVAADSDAENTETESGGDEILPYTVTVDEDGNTVYSIGDWEWSSENTDENTDSGVVNDQVRSFLHLRSGSGMEYDIIGHLLPGEEVQVVGKDGEWYQVVVPEKTGYVCRDYLDLLEKEKTDGKIDQEFMEMMLYLMMNSMEDEEASSPLTPDGNMSLVDDIGSSAGAGKQFITLVTRNGNYFYLIIDRDEDGNENVHFLNQVDEADLFSLMDEDEDSAYQKTQEAEETEKAAEKVTTEASSSEPEEGTQDARAEKKSVKVLLFVSVILLLAAAGGGYLYFQSKEKRGGAQKPDPDADYEEDESEEEYELPDEEVDEEMETADDIDEGAEESEPDESSAEE